MSTPYTSMDGTVYTDTDIMHPNPNDCTHAGANTCPTCDFDRHFANKHRELCPWFSGDCDCGDSSHHYCDKCDGVWCPERGCCDGPGKHQSPYPPDESKEARET